VAIITGATSGVGLEAARVLAANGAATWKKQRKGSKTDLHN
jgi:NADP-dependent 3-hydroxy acid dehydrogenase YdfG